jgi:hypothetical protein
LPLGEHVGPRRWMAVAISFGGLVLRSIEVANP